MKVSDLSIHNVEEAVAAAEAFLERCPTYDGSELSANVLFERHAKTGRPLTPEAFEFSFNELRNEGLIGPDDSGANAYHDLLSPVQSERDSEPETNEIEFTFISEEPEVSREEIEALSTKQIGDLLKQHDEQSAPPKSLNDEISGLSLGDLGHLIMKVSTQ